MIGFEILETGIWDEMEADSATDSCLRNAVMECGKQFVTWHCIKKPLGKKDPCTF